MWEMGLVLQRIGERNEAGEVREYANLFHTWLPGIPLDVAQMSLSFLSNDTEAS